jgi:uncharacterized membrane protein HdeD (DUF308 family)
MIMKPNDAVSIILYIIGLFFLAYGEAFAESGRNKGKGRGWMLHIISIIFIIAALLV